ncbi:hypothetical protein HRI_002138600 [Hibiscus trionum]|uniref:Reverse transcriptase domain-containing protein n=1 Tax=Hibiscus trionum TaxID=183268 RepID=A0A9W7M1X7_HIBTR|nr:hypothetical protein HRI_002138600 [Hibiscus trionum]
MGFGQRWRNWMKTCLSSAMISVLLNGSPTKPFAIKRGLRQGCSLSPMLFNIVGEALSQLLNKAVELGVFKGVKIGSSDMEISHIQFADDLVLFIEAEEAMVRQVKRVLKIFELAAGLSINEAKSKLYGVNVDDDSIRRMAEAINWGWGCHIPKTGLVGIKFR